MQPPSRHSLEQLQPSGQQCTWSPQATAFGPYPMQQPIPVVEKAVTIHVLLAGQEVGALGTSPSVGTDHALSSKSWPATTPRIPPLVYAAVSETPESVIVNVIVVARLPVIDEPIEMPVL